MEVLKKEIGYLKENNKRVIAEINQIKRDMQTMNSELKQLKELIKRLGDVL